jgi:hypothetical protein
MSYAKREMFELRQLSEVMDLMELSQMRQGLEVAALK